MTDSITAGSILVAGGMHLPGSFPPRSESDANGWALIQDTCAAFQKTIQEAGLTFFFMAGEIKATVYGFDRQKSLGVALQRLIAEVKSQHCNCVEITQVTSKSFLNVPYVSVYAHVRHIQKGLLFSGGNHGK